jgi:hypothetical protein
MAKWRGERVACLQDPQRTIGIAADVRYPLLPFERKVRSDYPSLIMKDLMIADSPESAFTVAIKVNHVINCLTFDSQASRNKPHSIKPIHAMCARCEPKKPVRRLRNGEHGSGRRTILYPPRRMGILGQALTRIERITCGRRQKQESEINTEHAGTASAEPLKTKQD